MIEVYLQLMTKDFNLPLMTPMTSNFNDYIRIKLNKKFISKFL